MALFQEHPLFGVERLKRRQDLHGRRAAVHFPRSLRVASDGKRKCAVATFAQQRVAGEADVIRSVGHLLRGQTARVPVVSWDDALNEIELGLAALIERGLELLREAFGELLLGLISRQPEPTNETVNAALMVLPDIQFSERDCLVSQTTFAFQ